MGRGGWSWGGFRGLESERGLGSELGGWSGGVGGGLELGGWGRGVVVGLKLP